MSSIENKLISLKISPIGMSFLEIKIKNHFNKELNHELCNNLINTNNFNFEKLFQECHEIKLNNNVSSYQCKSFSPIVQVPNKILETPSENQSFNCIVGRNANRIENGTFSLNNEKYNLITNWKTHFLHGKIGKSLWALQNNDLNENEQGNKIYNLFNEIQTPIPRILGNYISNDGEDGFPCLVHLQCSYSLIKNKIIIHLNAKNMDEERSTPISLTHHTYWNLSGTYENVFEDHELWINSSYYTEVNEDLITTGEILRVTKELDFSKSKKLGRDISSSFKGYDHNYVLNIQNRDPETGLLLAAVLSHPKSGRKLNLYTTLPGIQLYTGNSLNGQETIEGHKLSSGEALCLEPQFFPNAINHKHFPSTIVSPKQNWDHYIIYEFLL